MINNHKPCPENLTHPSTTSTADTQHSATSALPATNSNTLKPTAASKPHNPVSGQQGKAQGAEGLEAVVVAA